MRFQILGSLRVVFLLFQVLAAVKFDDELAFWGTKIRDVLSDCMLSAKVYSQLIIAQT